MTYVPESISNALDVLLHAGAEQLNQVADVYGEARITEEDRQASNLLRAIELGLRYLAAASDITSDINADRLNSSTT